MRGICPIVSGKKCLLRIVARIEVPTIERTGVALNPTWIDGSPLSKRDGTCRDCLCPATDCLEGRGERVCRRAVIIVPQHFVRNGNLRYRIAFVEGCFGVSGRVYRITPSHRTSDTALRSQSPEVKVSAYLCFLIESLVPSRVVKVVKNDIEQLNFGVLPGRRRKASFTHNGVDKMDP